MKSDHNNIRFLYISRIYRNLLLHDMIWLNDHNDDKNALLIQEYLKTRLDLIGADMKISWIFWIWSLAW